MKKSIISVFQDTGPCTIDIRELQKQWDDRFWLSEMNKSFRLMQYARKGTSTVNIKCDITSDQAKEIIEKLGLVMSQDFGFATWRKPKLQDVLYQNKLLLKALNNLLDAEIVYNGGGDEVQVRNSYYNEAVSKAIELVKDLT